MLEVVKSGQRLRMGGGGHSVSVYLTTEGGGVATFDSFNFMFSARTTLKCATFLKRRTMGLKLPPLPKKLIMCICSFKAFPLQVVDSDNLKVVLMLGVRMRMPSSWTETLEGGGCFPRGGIKCGNYSHFILEPIFCT